ncbi:MAG: D-glycero-beta-D-manno-heptose-7-phosphate kinase [Alphaproteobacteria bacterium]|nr:D-glycero-beta-D-manno-heptose-7-phosphate kinase [Alphaproteobacteria bacterium]
MTATAQDLSRILDRLPGVRILCVGDIMLDRFIYGHVARISPEAPIPIFTADREERMLGGAGNVVRNLLSLGASASFAAVVGDDAVANQLTQLVGEEAHLVPYLITERGRLSTKKTRYVAASQQLLRSDSETRTPVREETATTILELILPELAQHHAVILSDYGKGVLTPALCRAIIDAAREKQVPVFVDPKQRDVSIYAGATVLSPNLRELALAAGVDGFANDREIVAAASALARAHRFQYVLTTRGEHGMTLVDAQGLVAHVDATASEVFDVSGAGDTVIATLAATYAAGASMPLATDLANLAGGIVVGRLGTAVVHRSDLTAALYTHRALALQQKILPRDTALAAVTNWKRDGLTVGFTNGCFDIMHAGHISLLSDAKARCDKLVVALNTDASVRGLKGPTRPVNAEMDRAQVLAALGCVDAVVLFDEETPLALLELLTPDVLMKGADYAKEQVVGWQLVESYGGRVELLPLKEGYSTTGMIKKMTA